MLLDLGQPPYGYPTPDGSPETGEAWIGVGAMDARIRLAAAVANGEVASNPVERSQLWSTALPLPFEGQVEVIVGTILEGRASERTMAAMMTIPSAGDPASMASSAESRLRTLVAMAFASPEFQRR